MRVRAPHPLLGWSLALLAVAGVSAVPASAQSFPDVLVALCSATGVGAGRAPHPEDLLAQLEQARARAELARRTETERRVAYERIVSDLQTLVSGGDVPSSAETALADRLAQIHDALRRYTIAQNAEQIHRDDLAFLTGLGRDCCSTLGFSRDRLTALVDPRTGLVAQWRQQHGDPAALNDRMLAVGDSLSTLRAARVGPDGYAQERALRRAKGPAEESYLTAMLNRRDAEAEVEDLQARLAALSSVTSALAGCTAPIPAAPPPAPSPSGGGGRIRYRMSEYAPPVPGRGALKVGESAAEFNEGAPVSGSSYAMLHLIGREEARMYRLDAGAGPPGEGPLVGVHAVLQGRIGRWRMFRQGAGWIGVWCAWDREPGPSRYFGLIWPEEAAEPTDQVGAAHRFCPPVEP